ncbi:MAG: TolC family protein [Opitutales bacterium]
MSHPIAYALIAGLIGVLSSGLAMAEDTPGFQPDGARLHDYLEQAQSGNPEIQAFEHRYHAAIQRVPQAAALPDPVLQVTAFVESVQTRTGPQDTAFSLSQKIPWFGKLDSRESAASAEAEALWYAYQAQQLSLARRVSDSFFDYACLQEILRLTEEGSKLLQKLEPVVEAKVQGGSDVNALLRLKVEMGKVDDQLQSLEQQRLAKSAELSQLLGLQNSDVLPWPDWNPPVAVSMDVSANLVALDSQNPELEMLRRRVSSAEARKQIADLDRYPDVSIGLNYIQIGESATAVSDTGKDAWGVMLSVNLPLWVDKTRAARAEALATQRAYEDDLENRRNELGAELRGHLAFLEDASRRQKLYGKELVPLAEQAVENSRASYESGRTSIVELIDSERSLLDLRLTYWEAAAEVWKRRIAIQALSNQPLMGTFKATSEHE